MKKQKDLSKDEYINVLKEIADRYGIEVVKAEDGGGIFINGKPITEEDVKSIFDL